MTGPLLKTGSLTAFHPVGAVGNPVYLAAAQLRAAIARRLGADVADTFAIPQRNEDGDTVDWYAPQPGPVVPWSAASDSERSAAQERLLTVRRQIEDLGQRMEAAVSSEQQVFGRLLAHVMSFPEDDDVHLVNGQPVLTFWGFVKDRAAVGSDQLRSLDMHLAHTEPPPRRGLPWWAWFLLGLLLLALSVIALLTLRGCQEPPSATVTELPTATADTRQLTGAEPHGEPAMPEPEPTQKPPLAPDADPGPSDRRTLIGDRERTLTDIRRTGAADIDSTRVDRADTDTSAEVLVDDIARDADTAIVDTDAGAPPPGPADEVVSADESMIDEGTAEEVAADDPATRDVIDADAAPDAPAEQVLEDQAVESEATADDEALAAAVPDPADPTANAASAEEVAAEPATAESEAAAGDAEAGADEAATDAAGAEKPTTGPTDTVGAVAPAGADAETDSRADPAASAAAADAAGAAARTRAGARGGAPAVRIPPERLLNSGWRTSTTLLDPKDGSPIHLDYRLEDGAGKIRLQRGDGSVCESGAAAKVKDGRLLVDSAGEIVCADGTSFGRPQIDCTPQAGGKARCIGRYADGSTFPIDMQQQPD